MPFSSPKHENESEVAQSCPTLRCWARGAPPAGGARDAGPAAPSRAGSPFPLQALQLCCLCCASVAAALASDSRGGEGSGLNHGSYSPPPRPEKSFSRHFVPSFLTKKDKVEQLPTSPPRGRCARVLDTRVLFGEGECGQDFEFIMGIRASSCKSR